MNRSLKRVKQAARAAGLDITILTMLDSTRTAGDAASACGCQLSQIVKSLVFMRTDIQQLVLLLVAGHHQADLQTAAAAVGGPLKRTDPQTVRDLTGFSIGGVSPLGHKIPIPTYMDPELLAHETVWVAAGTPNSVFAISPKKLQIAVNAGLLQTR